MAGDGQQGGAAQAQQKERLPLMLVRLSGSDAVEAIHACRRRALEARSQQEPMTREALAATEMLELYEGEMEVSVSFLRAAYTVYRELGGGTSSIAGAFPASGSEDAFWHSVIKGSKTVYPEHRRRKLEKEERIKQSEGRRRELRDRAARRQYQEMVKNVHWGGLRGRVVETQPLYQASVGFNFIAGAATAGFIGHYVSGSLGLRDSYKWLVVSLCVVGMLILELMLYIIRTTEVERYKEKREKMEELGQKGLMLPGQPVPQRRIAPPRADREKIKTQ